MPLKHLWLFLPVEEYAMSEAPPATHESPQIAINPLVLHRSRLPFAISLASFLACCC